ncbi:MAG: dicarboxylate/amino acid:cation symporter [Verrucomicrobiales bacterium]
MWKALRRISLTQWIFISMALGVFIGWLYPEGSQNLKVLSNIFLRMIKCILVPLVFATLVSGIAKHGDDMKGVARLGFRSLVYFEIVTTLALFIGLFAVNIAKPGEGVKLPPPDPNQAAVSSAPITFSGTLEHIVPKSFFEAAATNDVLQVVFFAILFGVSLSQIKSEHKHVLVGWMDAVTETMFKFTSFIMKFAPIGIGAAMAVTVGHSGLGVLVNLAKLILTLYVALVIFCLLVLWPAALLARIPVLGFLKAVREPTLLAFATTSSEAAFPDAMKRMVAFGVPGRIVSFVMPLGYSFNLDGSTLYLAVASMFVAQAAGVDLTIWQQLLIIGTLMLTSKGMAGIPRASQVVLAGTLLTFNLPVEGVLLIIGVDELMDMARTSVNLVGNCLSTAVMARWEGEVIPDSEMSQAAPLKIDS